MFKKPKDTLIVRARLRTFRDNDNIERGQELTPEIERAITQSRASIIVLSERDMRIPDVALTSFCRSLSKDVRNHRRNFEIEVDKGSQRTEYKVNRWKGALTEVADLIGMIASGSEDSEVDFIAKIADIVNYKLDMKLATPANLIGMDS
ncbi:unnamed protein product [Lactuca saligna]|uniref:TIR domain-containing protein n=1 Tax=Lactuca saligna TaxID=75948 RepID=A0AA35YP94_LACSI|nr:unnamed protein product [Lactuca saligna]